MFKNSNEDSQIDTQHSLGSSILDQEKLLGGGSKNKDGMTLFNMAAYSVGHVYNDFWATWWFMYLLYFLTYPIGLGASKASFALLSGQIADGLATVTVGFLIDKTNKKWSIGQKPWYIAGVVLVIPTFLLTFNTWVLWDIVCGSESQRWSRNSLEGIKLFYYLLLPALFNVGWAAVQIATMSVVVNITRDQDRRDRLVSLRIGFSYISNLFTLIVAIILIEFIDDPIKVFRTLALIITGIGLWTCLIYIFGLPEARLRKQAEDIDNLNTINETIETEHSASVGSESGSLGNAWKVFSFNFGKILSHLVHFE